MTDLDLTKLNTEISNAYEKLRKVVKHSALERTERLDPLVKAEVYLKREDLQLVRSFKIRGAYNLIASLTAEELAKGVICASAGNHAQGFAFSCKETNTKGVVYMPEITPRQKISKVEKFGGDLVEIRLVGRTFDEAYQAAKEAADKEGLVFVHPFDDPRTVAGQGTIAVELLEDLPTLGAVLVPIGGGGLISGIATYLKAKNPAIKIIGVEPEGAPKMSEAMTNSGPVTLASIDTFVDGCAVKRAGDLTYKIIKKLVDEIVVVPEGQVCSTMIELYQNEGIITEPAGALAAAALELLSPKLKAELAGKKIVCLVSGGNNDISRYPEIMERSLIFKGLKHYFLVEFAQRPGELRKFLEKALGPKDDIVRFEYTKKTNKESGPALVGIELADKADYEPLVNRMAENEIKAQDITKNKLLFSFLV